MTWAYIMAFVFNPCSLVINGLKGRRYFFLLSQQTLLVSTYYLPNTRLEFQVVRLRNEVLDSTEPIVDRVHTMAQLASQTCPHFLDRILDSKKTSHF